MQRYQLRKIAAARAYEDWHAKTMAAARAQGLVKEEPADITVDPVQDVADPSQETENGSHGSR